MIKRQFFGSYDNKTGKFRLSFLPPDAPVRPSVEIDKSDLREYLERRRGSVVWWPALPAEMAVELSWTENRFPVPASPPRQPKIKWPGRNR